MLSKSISLTERLEIDASKITNLGAKTQSNIASFIDYHNLGDWEKISNNYLKGQLVVNCGSFVHYLFNKRQSSVLSENWYMEGFDKNNLKVGDVVLLGKEYTSNHESNKLTITQGQQSLAYITGRTIQSVLVLHPIKDENLLSTNNLQHKENPYIKKEYLAETGPNNYLRMRWHHFALYAGDNSYISKDGKDGNIIITNYEELKEKYPHNIIQKLLPT